MRKKTLSNDKKEIIIKYAFKTSEKIIKHK